VGISDYQLTILAQMRYQKKVPSAIGQVFSSVSDPIQELIDMGLVKTQDIWVAGSFEIVLTQQGEEVLDSYEAIDIINALLREDVYIPVEYYVKALPWKHLPPFIVSDVDFIRVAALERCRELENAYNGAWRFSNDEEVG